MNNLQHERITVLAQDLRLYPRHLSAQFITECATALRFAMFGTRGKPVEANELAAKATRFVINGRPMRIVWDIEHDVRDVDGKSVLGVCEHDPDEPDAVMISVSGPRLASRPATCARPRCTSSRNGGPLRSNLNSRTRTYRPRH